AEMVLIRIAYTSDLPAPDAVLRALSGQSTSTSGARQAAVTQAHADRGALNSAPKPLASPSPPAVVDPTPPQPAGPNNLEEIAELAGRMRDLKLKIQIEDCVSLVRFEPGRIEVNLVEGAAPNLLGELAEKLSRWTGRRWVVALSREEGE